jgi:hypothetical protein
VSFALDDPSYEIDLSKKNAVALRRGLDLYISAARRQGGARPTGRRRGAKATGNGAKPKRDFDLAQLREWAGANGVAVPSRGRITQAVVDEYKAVGGGRPGGTRRARSGYSDALLGLLNDSASGATLA